MKTSWGRHDKQLADGTLILTSPAGQTYVTQPGSARTAMMPSRSRTRAQDRAARIAAERHQNQHARQARHVDIYAELFRPRTPFNDDNDPSPF